MEFKIEDDSEAYSDTNSDFNSSTKSKRKSSYVWTFFRPIQVNGKQVNECIICNALVGKQTSNLARHLITTHSITKPTQKGSPEDKTARFRPSRSFVWKYSTKEDLNHARCHFCNRVLYCGGGNTSNLSKHLRRRHMDLIDERNDSMTDRGEEIEQATSAIIEEEFMDEVAEEGEEVDGSENGLFRVYSGDNSGNDGKNSSLGGNSNKDRKGSYVWNFCDKISRHTIRCKLCSKVMSFHGTANVITHLQRRHNIVGPLCKDPSSLIKKELKETPDVIEEPENSLLSRRRSMGTVSVVWKYCKRIGRDTVRCSFCKKNLSYQGTSNLQRHLHRMHGIVTQGRNYKTTLSTENENELTYLQFDAEFLWEYLDDIENGTKAKCKMCDAVLDAKDMVAISKHLVMSHALRPPDTNPKRPKRLKSNSKVQDYSDDSDDYNGDWSNFGESENIEEITELNTKKDDSFFDEIIEEDIEPGSNCDEEPMDPNMTQATISNPLSPQSVQSCAGDMSPDRRNNKHSSCLYKYNPKLQKLNEERLRMETEYFKEKAAFFRMQKYFIALQAKKMRIEMERLNNASMEYTGPTYTVNVDIPQEELAILPTQ